MRVSEVFEGLWLVKKGRCKLIGNRFVIPHDTIPSTVVRKPPRQKHRAKLMRRNEIEIPRNPNAQSISLSAHPCKRPFAAKHMLFLPTHTKISETLTNTLSNDSNIIVLKFKNNGL